jgi:hypothetical protein
MKNVYLSKLNLFHGFVLWEKGFESKGVNENMIDDEKMTFESGNMILGRSII